MNNNIIGEIVDFSHDGRGILKNKGLVIFVPYVVIGDIVEIKITDIKRNMANAVLVKIIENSKDRIYLDFDAKNLGGGVPLVNYEYKKQVEWKVKRIEKEIFKSLSYPVKVNEVFYSNKVFRYRNHSQLFVEKKNEKILIGYKESKSNNIIDIKEEFLQEDISQKVIDFLRIWMYKNSFIFKAIGIRTNENGQAMIILVTDKEEIPRVLSLIHLLILEVPETISIYQNIITKKEKGKTYGRKYIKLFGKDKLKDFIGEYEFNLSPNSFFQINRNITLKMYSYIKDKLELCKKDIVLDLYSGIGTISIFIANFIKKVIGVEINKSSIKDAYENANANGIKTAEFIYGDAALMMEDIYANKVIIDPPRAGIKESLIKNIKKLGPSHIAYVSCNPSSLARDLKYFLDEYTIENIAFFDMFPNTSSIETVVILKKLTLNSIKN